ALDYAVQVDRYLKQVRQDAQTNIYRRQRQYQQYYNQGRSDIKFNIGQLVMKKVMGRKPGRSAKLDEKWNGPWRIIKQQGRLNYVIENILTKQQDVAHVQKLCRC
ncbi:unnamed protein product, partial [Didymodactylos carnosus]